MAKQKDGRYRTKVIVGKTAEGKNIVKWVQGATKKELEANRKRILTEYRDGVVAENSSILAMDWIYKWYDAVCAPRQKEEGARQKKRTVEIYVEPYLKDKQLRAVSAYDLQEILNKCKKGHTIQTRIKGVLKGAFAAAYANGMINRDVSVALTVKMKSYKSRRALTDEETKQVEKLLEERSTEPLLLALLYYTGMRIGEILGLQWKDVDLKRDFIRGERSLSFKTMSTDTTKTEAGVRDIPVCAELKAILKDYQGIGEAFVVQAAEKGGPVPEMSYRRRIKRISKAIGSEELTAHYFRYNYATRLYDAKVDPLTAAKIFGHSDPTTMLKIYTDIEHSKRSKRSTDAAKRAFQKKVAKKLPIASEE